MLRYGTEWYSTFLPVMPCLSTRRSRRSVNRMVSRISWYAAWTCSFWPSSRAWSCCAAADRRCARCRKVPWPNSPGWLHMIFALYVA